VGRVSEGAGCLGLERFVSVKVRYLREHDIPVLPYNSWADSYLFVVGLSSDVLGS
jgi:hypothetical protein